jgi:hypothetical protein
MDSCYIVPLCVLAVVVFIIVLIVRAWRRSDQRDYAKEEERMRLEGEQARSRMAEFEDLIEKVARDGVRSVLARLLEILFSENRDELCVAAVEAIGERYKRGEAPAFDVLLDLLKGAPGLCVRQRMSVTEIVNGQIFDRVDAEELREGAIRSRLALLAAKKLGEIRDPLAVEPLLRELLKHGPEEPLYVDMVWALYQMIKPGDERAMQVLLGPIAPGEAEIEPDELLSLAQLPALGLFGSARAVLSLVATARHWSGEKCQRRMRADGGSFYTCTCANAVQALENILERDAANASEKALRSVLELHDLTSQSHPDSAQDTYQDLRQPIDCATIQRRHLEP